MGPYRYMCFAVIETLSPLHIGGAGEDGRVVDQPVVRDLENIPFIPGSTLSGSFSSFIDNTQKEKWLGISNCASGDTLVPPSLVTFDDLRPIPSQRSFLSWPVEMRDRNTIMRGSLTVKPDHHFQYEVLPVGTLFCLSCRGDFDNYEDAEEFKKKFGLFLSGGGQFGSCDTSYGGRWKSALIKFAKLDLSTKEHLLIWFLTGHGYEWEGDYNRLEADFKGVLESFNGTYTKRAPWQLTLDITIEGLHMSAGASRIPRKGYPDNSQATRCVFRKSKCGGYELHDDEYVDYGSAVKGRFRTVMEMLLRTYLKKAQPELKRAELCKIVPEDPTQQGSIDRINDFFGHHTKKGGWSVSEEPWKRHDGMDGRPDVSTEDHVRLCEFTQHVINQAKFQFAPLTNGETRVVISLPADHAKWQEELICYAAELLSMNILPWGGHGSRGYLGAKLCIANTEKDKLACINGDGIKDFIKGVLKINGSNHACEAQ